MVLLWQVLLQMKLCDSGKCSNRLRIQKNLLSCRQDRHVGTTQVWKWIRLTKKCAREAHLTSSWLTSHRYFKLHLLSSTGSAWDEGFINFDWRTLTPSLQALSSYNPWIVNEVQLLMLVLSSHPLFTPCHFLDISHCVCRRLLGLVCRDVTAILRSCELEIFICDF